MAPNRLSWGWIKEKSSTDFGANILVLLAKKSNIEPHPLDGQASIRDWLLEFEDSAFYCDILAKLQTAYHNIKFFDKQGTLQPEGAH